jgi:hypothetical protein
MIFLSLFVVLFVGNDCHRQDLSLCVGFFIGKDRHDLPLGDRYDPGNAGCLRQEQISDSYLFSNSFLCSITFSLVINILL